MTGRSRVLAGLLGALATLVVALPLTRLFDESTWFTPAALGVLIVALSGMVLRAWTASTGAIIGGQLLAGGWYVVLTQLGSTTSFRVLPSGRTLPLLVEHVRDAEHTITTYTAPAPETSGITVLLVVMVIIVGLAVDMSTATAASPVMAGLPLLALFLAPAANSSGSLPWGWFLAGASLWLVMVVHQSDVDLREWTTSIPLMGHEDGQGVAERSHRWQAARLGALGLTAAILAATFVPHLPTRYVLDGLGHGGGGPGDGIRLSTELDLKRSLESPSQEPVLRYTTDDRSPEPLRVAVVEDFNGGFGRMRSTAPEPRAGYEPPDPLTEVPESIARERRTLIVDDNAVAAPQLALPTFVNSVETDGVPWSLGQDGTARVQRTPGTYSATYTELEPQEEDFTGSLPEQGDPITQRFEYLALDPASGRRIQELSNELAPEDGNSLRTAQAIQEYLRGSDFSYSLDLPSPADAPSDPVLSFLETKVGYCQQFAATMTLLARAQGIPARVVVGFLPGELVDEDQRVIRASDAHAWPELYLEGVGWVRFEPTPGSRAADLPGYSIDTSIASGGADTEGTTSSSTSTAPTDEAAPQDQAVDEAAAPTDGGPGRWLWWLLGALAAVAALAIMPITAALARRRHRARAADDAARVEVAWQDLIDHIEDLGVEPPVGATPRQAGRWLGQRVHLDPEGQGHLDHVVATVEQARYGAPEQPVPDISADASAVISEVRTSRQRAARVRAFLWPRAAVSAWRSLRR